jgi:hypothetical protein
MDKNRPLKEYLQSIKELADDLKEYCIEDGEEKEVSILVNTMLMKVYNKGVELFLPIENENISNYENRIISLTYENDKLMVKTIDI